MTSGHVIYISALNLAAEKLFSEATCFTLRNDRSIYVLAGKVEASPNFVPATRCRTLLNAFREKDCLKRLALVGTLTEAR